MKLGIYMILVVSAFAFSHLGSAKRHHLTGNIREPVLHLPEASTAAEAVPQPVDGLFFASGYQGDVSAVKHGSDDRNCFKPHEASMRFEYRPQAGKLGWAAVSFQSPANNWGDKKGRDFSTEHFRRVRFAARGLQGGEKIIFTSGGGTKEAARFPASYQERSLGTVSLTSEWQVFTIDLGDNVDLRNVTTALTWSTNQELNPDGAIFFLSDIAFQ